MPRGQRSQMYDFAIASILEVLLPRNLLNSANRFVGYPCSSLSLVGCSPLACSSFAIGPVQQVHICPLLPTEVATGNSIVSVTETEQKKAGFTEIYAHQDGYVLAKKTEPQRVYRDLSCERTSCTIRSITMSLASLATERGAAEFDCMKSKPESIS